MPKPLFSKSIRKHIRSQKARIRREFSDFKKQQELIQELYQRFTKKDPKTKEEKPKKVIVKKKVVAKKKKAKVAAK